MVYGRVLEKAGKKEEACRITQLYSGIEKIKMGKKEEEEEEVERSRRNISVHKSTFTFSGPR